MRYHDLEGVSQVERLEDGVFLERLLPDFEASVEEAPEEEALLYGRIPNYLYRENEVNSSGNILLRLAAEQLSLGEIAEQDIPEQLRLLPEARYSLENIKQVYESCGLCAEELENVSLNDLLELVDSENPVLCYVNTWMLDLGQIEQFDWATPNSLVAVYVVDLTDPSMIVIQYASADAVDRGVQCCSWPVFQKAWACSGRTTLVVSKGEKL